MSGECENCGEHASECRCTKSITLTASGGYSEYRAKFIEIKYIEQKEEKMMNDDELRDYVLLKKIQGLCDDAREWNGPICFENIWDACSSELRELKMIIGQRIIDSTIKNE